MAMRAERLVKEVAVTHYAKGAAVTGSIKLDDLREFINACDDIPGKLWAVFEQQRECVKLSIVQRESQVASESVMVTGESDNG